MGFWVQSRQKTQNHNPVYILSSAVIHRITCFNVTMWRELFLYYWSYNGNPLVNDEFLTKSVLCRAYIFSYLSAWTSFSDKRSSCDVTVMSSIFVSGLKTKQTDKGRQDHDTKHMFIPSPGTVTSIVYEYPQWLPNHWDRKFWEKESM